MPRAPDYASPVIGFRAWVVDGDGYLYPYSFNQRWEPGQNRATCLRDPSEASHHAPASDCSCGLYGLHDDQDRRLKPLRSDRGHAVGAIAAWGTMEVHWTGFRAEYACVTALAYSDRCSELHRRRLRAAAERYGVALVHVNELRAAAARHGDWLPGLTPAPAEPEPAHLPPLRPDEVRPSGIFLQGHLWVKPISRGLRIGPTRALMALLADRERRVLATTPGSPVARGDAIAVIHSPGYSAALCSPVDGQVRSINAALLRRPGRLNAAGLTWVADLSCSDAAIGRAQISWEPLARTTYRNHLRTLRHDRGLLDSVSLDGHERWLGINSWRDLGAAVRHSKSATPDHPLPDDESIAVVAADLDELIHEDKLLERALARLELAAAFEVCDREVGVLIGNGASSFQADEQAKADVKVTLTALELHRFLLGDLDLGAMLGADIGLEGSRQDAMVFTSVFQRLFPRYRLLCERRRARDQQSLRAA